MERKAFLKYDRSESDPKSPLYTGPVQGNVSSRLPLTEEEVNVYCTPGFPVQDIQGMKWNVTDKQTTHAYHDLYRWIAANHPVKRMLEIGISEGMSLNYWMELFSKSVELYAIDIQVKPDARKLAREHENIVLYRGDSCNTDLLDDLPHNWDFVCDDGAHTKESQSFALNNLYNKMNKDGIIIIEDIHSLENVYFIYDNFTGNKENLRILDRRSINGRFDDILVFYVNGTAENHSFVINFNEFIHQR